MAIYSTIWSNDPDFNRDVRVIDWRTHSLRSFEKAILRCGPEDVLIVNGALGFKDRWRDMLSVVVARALTRSFGLVISDATWQPRATAGESRAGALYGINDYLNRQMVQRLNDAKAVFCFLSRTEVTDFLAATRSPQSRAVFTPFSTSIPARYIGAANGDRNPVIFSGGDTLRDWTVLREALDGCGVRVRVATRHVSGPWPSNFDVGPCPPEEFYELLRTAAAGVLALRSDVVRSCGQQTYLNLLRVATPVVVNDAAGVRDHLGGVPGGFIVPNNDPGAIRSRVEWLLDPANAPEVWALAAAGQAYVAQHLSPAAYLANLVRIASALGERLRSTP